MALTVSACGSDSGAEDGATIRVFAAASLSDAFAALEVAYEAAHPGDDVDVNLAGSSALRAQILDGAPADVFAAANQVVMEQLRQAGAATGDAPVFATNQLTIAVPAENPGDIEGLDDFDRAELFLGLCAPGVPCGDLAAHVLDAAGVTPSIDTLEPDVRALLTKIAEGELDGGLVYRTDVEAERSVAGVDLANSADATAHYPISVLDDAPAPAAAARFVAFVLGAEGQRTLADFGFGSP